MSAPDPAADHHPSKTTGVMDTPRRATACRPVPRARRKRVVVSALSLLLGVSLAGCSGESTAGPDSRVAAVELSQRSVTLGLGGTTAVEVTVRDASGAPVTGTPLYWSSSDPDVVRVSSTGVITAVGIGSAQVAATVQGRSAVLTVTVAPVAVASVQLSPTDVRLTVGSSARITARLLAASGSELTGRSVRWSSGASSIVAVDSAGRVTALAPGAATITATSEGRTASVAVTVAATAVSSVRLTPTSAVLVQGQTTQLLAEPRDNAGKVLTGRTVTWSSSAPQRASVSSAGLVTALQPGTATITASSEGRSGTVSITIAPRPVGALVVSPSQLALTAGQSLRLLAQVTDDEGNVLSGRSVSFSSANADVATVSGDGTVTAVAAGTTLVTANAEGKSATVSVTVSNVPVARVVVTPEMATLTVGESVELRAEARDADGRVLTGREVVWSSGAPSIARVDASGTVTALATGTAVVLATADGRVGSATITVRSIPVTRVEIAPTRDSLDVGGTRTLTATVYDADGQVVTGRDAWWSSSNTEVATVSTTGEVRALAAGTTTISASVDGVVGTATIVVRATSGLSVGRIEVTPAVTTLYFNGPENRSVQLSATAYIAGENGVVVPNVPVRWRSSDTDVATVSATGRVTAHERGEVTISATFGTFVGTARIVVVRKP